MYRLPRFPLPGRTAFFLIVVWLQCGYTGSLFSQSLVINSSNTYTLLPGSLSFYASTDSNLSFASAREKYRAGLFQNANQQVFNAGIAAKYYWFHFTIENGEQQPESLVIDVHNSRLNELKMFEVKKDSTFAYKKLGDFLSFEERLMFNKDFMYPVTIKAGESREYFLFINQVGQTLLLPVVIQKEEYYRRSMGKNYIFDGFTYGILLFTVILSFLFFISTRHVLYLFYSLYILSSILWFFAYFGLGYQYLWPDFPIFNTISPPAFASLNLLLNILICETLLNLKENSPHIYIAGLAAKIALAVIAVFPFIVNLNKASFIVNQSFLIVFLTVVIASMFILLFSIINNARRGYEEAKFYFVASILKASSIFYLALLEIGLAPGVYFIERSMQLGILVEIMLLIFALAKRYSKFKQKSSRLINKAHEESRAMMAGEMHEGISGALTVISYQVKGFLLYTELPKEKSNEVEAIAENLSKVQQVARNISHHLTPEDIAKDTVPAAIKTYIKNLQTYRKTEESFSQLFRIINLSEQELQDLKMDLPIKLNIFRIVQELITNIIKHSEATTAEIVFALEKKMLVVIVQDNGKGIAHTWDNDNKGIGLKSLKSRASVFKGSINISDILSKEDYKKNARLYNYTIFDTGTIANARFPTFNDINFADY